MVDPLAVRAVDAINAIFGGSQQGSRAAHAKGTLVAGRFTPTPEAAQLTRAEHMQGGPVRTTVRFSNGSGDPAAPDFEPLEGRGMATKLYLESGAKTDVVALSLPSFFARTPEDFVEFTEARKPDPETGQPDMERIGAYLERLPEAMNAIQAVLGASPPASYATLAYNSIHSFRWIDPDGEARYVRYRWEPEAGEETLEPEVAKERGADYLQRDIAERAGQGAAFRLLAVLAEEGDRVDDSTVAFPKEREQVEVGRLELTGVEEGREGEGDVLVMDPARLVDGIELSADPILRIRPHAYAVSVERRAGAPPPADLPE